MNYLIEGGNSELRYKKILSLGEEVISYKKAEDDDPTSFGIDAIRDLKERLSTKHTEPITIYFSEAERLTIPAQNAFLKLLEEPGANISFCLSVKNKQALLPTIVSRCVVLKIKQEQEIGESVETTRCAQAFLQAVGKSPGEALKYKEGIKKQLKGNQGREYLTVWLAVVRDALIIKTATPPSAGGMESRPRQGITSEVSADLTSEVGELAGSPFGNEGRLLTFPSLVEETTKAFAPFDIQYLVKVGNEGLKMLGMLELKQVGADKIASVFLMKLCTPRNN